jgi:hypothetical protein
MQAAPAATTPKEPPPTWTRVTLDIAAAIPAPGQYLVIDGSRRGRLKISIYGPRVVMISLFLFLLGQQPWAWKLIEFAKHWAR